jgi:2,3-bisphosphoglycerate-independent phosphoglycerate mutase
VEKYIIDGNKNMKIMVNETRSKIVFIFLDGFGVGAIGSQNPIYSFKVLERVLGTCIATGLSVTSNSLIAKGIDACMNMPGIPQSATGQTALFTGINAAKLLGYPLPAYPDAILQKAIRESNIYIDAGRFGRSATFANAYRKEYFNLVAAEKLSHSVTTHCCLSAGLPLRDIESYNRRKAVFWDITGEFAGRDSLEKIEVIAPELAGSVICGLSQEFDLVVFESFLPDLIGHSREMNWARKYCGVLDRFLSAIIDGIDKRTTVVVTSDHGNFEDLSTGSHTLNPVVLLASGPDAPLFSKATTIIDVPAIILSVLKNGHPTRI